MVITVSEAEKRDRYVIPHNYKDRGGLFGLFDTRKFVEGVAVSSGVAVLILPFIISTELPVAAKVFIVAIPCLIIFLIGAFGLHGEPWSRILVYWAQYVQHKRKLAYRLEVKECDEVDDDEKQKGEAK